ncbi:TetR/AcrR family transcriptional regulator [Streptomyces sulphureus]|uniref:TetR/AcrR family transcriptional regulator n=1 Tax=Streptomyces sulphureus TaxID=47758 RepID=UPI00036D47EB|nr:TetR/AcrR family transcriptional regulator [Streptomyces sulphureus]
MTKGEAGAVWFREERTGRARPQLSRERITAAAVELLDGEGVQKLSMRTLAARLDAHATSLYWHVATKEDVLDLALDAVLGELDPPPPSDDWRRDLTAFATGLRAVLLAHPWAAHLAGTRPLAGPQALRATEYAYAALASAGFDESGLAAAAGVVSHYVIGSAQAEAVWGHRADEEAARTAVAGHLASRTAEYPLLASSFSQVEKREEEFGRGWELVLAGIAAGGARA